jgi:hypothetical protein
MSDPVTKTHSVAIRTNTHELVRQLNNHLGPTLVATLANVRDRKLPHKWAKDDGPEPRSDSYSKLLVAHRIWAMLSAAESDSVARAWFIGANPRLDEEAPVMCLRNGREQDVIGAAKAFVEGLDD